MKYLVLQHPAYVLSDFESFVNIFLMWDSSVSRASTKRPGAVLMWVRFPGATRDLVFPYVAFSADSVTVFIQPLCAIACINIYVHIQNLAAIPLFGFTKILHTLIGMGELLLQLLDLNQVRWPKFSTGDNEVPNRNKGKATQISDEGQWSTKQKQG